MSFAPPPDDPGNPYAPPLAELRGRPDLTLLAGGATIPPTVDAVLSRSWQIYKARLGICMAIVVGAMGLNWVFSILVNMLLAAVVAARNPNAIDVGVQIVGNLATIGVQFWLTIGQTIAILKVAKGRDTTFSDIFTGGPFFPSMIGAAVLYTLVALGVLLVCMVPGGVVAFAGGGQSPAMIVMFVVGGLVALIALILIGLRLSQFTYLIVDRGAGAVDSLTLSNRISTGREGQIFLVGLVAVAINLGGALACLVGLFFTIPLTYLMASVLYLALTGQPTAGGPGESFPTGVKPLFDSDFDAPG